VQDVPCHPSQIDRDTVSTVKRVRTEGERVYDLDVEGNHNFFAEEILVHNCFIIDDPFKGPAEANSELIRQNIDDWYQSVVLGRYRKGGVIILIQTRWHEDDLAGRLLQREPDDWYHINLPAICEEHPDDPSYIDPIGRIPGQALCPELFDLEQLAEKRKGMTPYWWSAMYQQSPQVDGGGIFQSSTFRYYTKRTAENGPGYYMLQQPDGAPLLRRQDQEYRRFTTVDTALTVKTYSDYTVLLTCAFTSQKELLLLDCQRVREEGVNHLKLIEASKKMFLPDYFAIEETSSSLTLIQTMRRHNIPFKSLRPDKDKVSRAFTAQQMLQNGRVYFPQGAAWLPLFEKELLIFDKGTHDDQVDAFSYACLEAARWEHGPTKPRQREPVTTEEKAWAQIKRRREGNKHHNILGQGF